MVIWAMVYDFVLPTLYVAEPRDANYKVVPPR
jgi:hypothetical protein